MGDFFQIFQNYWTAFFFDFPDCCFPLPPDLEYFKFFLILVPFGPLLGVLGIYPIDSIVAIICAQLTVNTLVRVQVLHSHQKTKLPHVSDHHVCQRKTFL
jgi:hypothetical protein